MEHVCQDRLCHWVGFALSIQMYTTPEFMVSWVSFLSGAENDEVCRNQSIHIPQLKNCCCWCPAPRHFLQCFQLITASQCRKYQTIYLHFRKYQTTGKSMNLPYIEADSLGLQSSHWRFGFHFSVAFALLFSIFNQFPVDWLFLCFKWNYPSENIEKKLGSFGNFFVCTYGTTDQFSV